MEENNFDKKYLLQITNELYHLTLLFPKREPLRYKMRELADEVLADFVSLPQENHHPDRTKVVRDSKKLIEILDSFFDIVKAQGWVKASEVLNLQQEYSKINEGLIKLKSGQGNKKIQKQDKEIQAEPEKVPVLGKEEEKPISERQKRILRVLREKGKMQVGEVKNIFSEVSKRTLRRDFRNLLKYDLVEKMGERNNTFYQIKDRTGIIMVGQR